MEKGTINDIGVIHGRFQVLHNDHLRYLLDGKRHCRHLVVGITNPDPESTGEEQADPHRSRLSANPLTYYERYRMVNTVLKAAGLDPDAFSVVPLPINHPQRYHHYVPMDALFFLAIYDEWGRKKYEYFKQQGLRTHILRDVPIEQKGLSAGEVRDRMARGERWEHLVPEAAVKLLREWNVADRIRRLLGLQTD